MIEVLNKVKGAKCWVKLIYYFKNSIKGQMVALLYQVICHIILKK